MSAGISPLVSTKEELGRVRDGRVGGVVCGGVRAGGDLAIVMLRQWRVLAAWCLAQGYSGTATLLGD